VACTPLSSAPRARSPAFRTLVMPVRPEVSIRS
jgi:hypothetical protein